MTKTTKYIAKVPNEAGRIDYSTEENAVWRDLVLQQQPNVLRYSAQPYLDGQNRLNLPPDRVPQCKEVSEN